MSTPIHDIEEQLEETLGRLHHVLQSSSHTAFFHPVYSPELISATHAGHELFFGLHSLLHHVMQVHHVINKEEFERLVSLQKKVHEHWKNMLQLQHTLEANNQEFFILEKMKECFQELLLEMNVLLSNEEVARNIDACEAVKEENMEIASTLPRPTLQYLYTKHNLKDEE